MGVGAEFFVLYINRQRFRIFYLPGKVIFCAFMRNIEWMNEKAIFSVFFFRHKKRMNEWPLNFSVEKKKNKTTQKCGKKHTQVLYKKRNFIKISLNDRWTFPRELKKNMLSFSRFAETLFWDMNELMTNVHFRVKKIR